MANKLIQLPYDVQNALRSGIGFTKITECLLELVINQILIETDTYIRKIYLCTCIFVDLQFNRRPGYLHCCQIGLEKILFASY